MQMNLKTPLHGTGWRGHDIESGQFGGHIYSYHIFYDQLLLNSVIL